MKIDFQKILVKIVPISLTDRLFFIANLRVMMRAGLPLSDSLKTLAMQTDRKMFKTIIEDIRSSVERGDQLSSAMSRHPEAFSPIVVSMVAVGEVSGTLEANLEQLSTQLKKDHELRSRIKSAMAYPIVVLTATVGIVAAMVVYIIPRMVSIFRDINVSLPLSTRILIAVSDFAVAHGLLILFAAIILAGVFLILIKRPKGKSLLHLFFLNFPIIGKIVKKVNLARFTRTLSSLLSTDVPIVKSFEITADVLGNVHYRAVALAASEELKKGVGIADTLAAHGKLFPPLVLQMVSVGEKSGTLDSLLKELAMFFEEEVDETLKGLSTIIEPLLILFLGGTVGGIAVSIMAPIYSLTQSF